MSHGTFPWLLVTRGFFSLMNEGLLSCLLHPGPPPLGLAVLLKPWGRVRARLLALLCGSGPGSVCCALRSLSPGSVLQGSCCDRLPLTDQRVRALGLGGAVFRVPRPRAELTTEEPPQRLRTPDMPPSAWGREGRFRLTAPSPGARNWLRSRTACRLAAVAALWVRVRARPPQTPASCSFSRLGALGTKRGSETHSQPFLPYCSAS